MNEFPKPYKKTLPIYREGFFKRPEALAERAKQSQHLILRGGSPVGFRYFKTSYKTKNPVR
jgi:hypothetical protein